MRKIDKYDKEFLKKLLEDMLSIRRFEEKAGQMYGLRKIGGFCHLYSGQEAVAVGSINPLDLKKDYVVSAYRDHGHALMAGLEPKYVMAELYGKKTGCSKGKGGSMHMFSKENHMFGGNGIVGAQIPIATGVALKQRYNNEDGVTLCYFGDGAIHQGAFHEAMNLSSIWDLPVLYICENNHYGMGTDFKRVSSVDDLSVMGKSYNIPGKQVDGMDVIAVYEEVEEALKKVRKGEPVFLEILTYRYKGHSMSDPAKYRSKKELEKYKNNDPILMLSQEMKENDMLTDNEFSEIDEEIKKRVQEAVDFAEESEEPSIESMYEDVLDE
ncbi:MAG: pyruvate dehydrogenase (acetyl-transferring) E1 component subunit alpha [Spirochaetia bacterium]